MGAGRLFAVLAASCLLAAGARAEESSEKNPSFPKPNFKYNTVTTKEGLVFRVPAGMPVEVRGGIQAPIPFDEYMYARFQSLETKLEGRLSAIEAKLKRIENVVVPPASEAPSSGGKDTGILKAGTE